jgi:ABC-type transport system involved in cytochrome c biogenesis permease subunit
MGDTNNPLDQPLADALNGMTTAQLNAYKADNSATLINTITGNYANSFLPSLNNVASSANNYDILTNYTINSRNLDTTLDDLKGQQATNLNIASRNVATASRFREIKEWYYNNKLDTLFIFQLIFISITFIAVLAYLMKLGFIGAGVVGAMVGILIIVNILVIANRAVYTDKVRDKRYWSKRAFGVVGSPLPGGILASKCP